MFMLGKAVRSLVKPPAMQERKSLAREDGNIKFVDLRFE